MADDDGTATGTIYVPVMLSSPWRWQTPWGTADDETPERGCGRLRRMADDTPTVAQARRILLDEMLQFIVDPELMVGTEIDALIAAVRAENAPPILSKYHGPHGFELERFIADYNAWTAQRRS